MLGLLISLITLILMMRYWRGIQKEHDKRIDQLSVRIHVNGIRGKSTVTRLVAGVLREGGYRTIAKTTGSAARIIYDDGNESPIPRIGAPTIIEQIDIIEKYVKPDVEAVAIECMAVNPHYQQVSQDLIVKGNITVITNVREDHQDVMGHTLPEIADALSNTIPYNGLLITSESRQYLRDQLERNARARGSDFLYADPDWVTEEDMRDFNYLSFKDNLAVGLALAKMLDIPREIAIRGMRKAIPDVGAVFVQRAQLGDKELVWAPLFAVNDRESTILGIESLRPYHKPDATRIGVLNNRYDRAVRATKFAEIAAKDLNLDYYVTFGAYEEQVTKTMVDLGYPRERIINLGFSRKPKLEDILAEVAALISGDQGLLIGMVNIHTPQAELLMEFFHHLRNEKIQDNELVWDLGHVPESVVRRRYLLSHMLVETG